MITCNHAFRAVSIAALFVGSLACDSGSPSRTPDDIAGDSALAADLALANRDTLVVDSIGAYREVDAAERAAGIDTASTEGPVAALPDETVTPAEPPAAATVRAAPPREIPATTPEPAPGRSPAPTRAAPKLIKGSRACSSPLPANQSECVKVTLAATDMRLNRIYRALITEMRRQEKVAPGAKDPPSVERLRVSQRSWLVYRDNECRKRGRGREGALWARPRVRCLGEFSARRANELADNFSRLTSD